MPDQLKRQIWREWRPDENEWQTSRRGLQLGAKAIKVAANRDQFENALERDNWTDERKK